ncbi:MAG: protein kinase [Ktedonobacterales bacterium]|nr:protein kinase [Ktedonobacterales bacterium]
MATDISQTFSGLRLSQRYQLSEPLAHGGLCVVYRGDDVVLRRPIAIKAVPGHLAPLYREALHRTAMLAHPAAVAVYDAVEHDGWLFLVQEYVDTRPLSAYITVGVPTERAIALVGQLARALAYTHAQGMTHGDLTPAAVLVDRQAVVRINNFGLPRDEAYFDALARQLTRMEIEERDTMVAPSRAHGDGPWLAHGEAEAGEMVPTGDPLAGDAGAQDVWAVGALLWQLLTTPEVEAEHAPPPAGQAAPRRQFRDEIPEAVREVVRQCVSFRHPERITTAETLALTLREVARRLASARPSSAPITPPTLRAARDAAADMAEWSDDETPVDAAARARLGAEEVALFNAPTDPLGGDMAATQPTATHHLSERPIGPRLTLPSRPTGGLHGPFAMGSPAPQWELPGQGATTRPMVDEATGGVSLLMVVILGGLLFLIFFVIGYLTPALLAR